MYWLYVLVFPNGKRYFGLTKDPQRRETDHRWALKSHTRLRAAIRKYGAKSFSFTVLCAGSREYIADLEIAAVVYFKTRDPRFGYNMAPGGKISPMADPEIAARAGASQRGRVFSAEHLAKLSKAGRGRKATPETRAKLSKSMRARPSDIYLRGEKHPNYGRKLTFRDPEARKAAMSAARKGKPLRPEVIAARSARMMGHPVSAETRAKQSAAAKKRKRAPHSAETRAKMSAARKGKKFPRPEPSSQLTLPGVYNP